MLYILIPYRNRENNLAEFLNKTNAVFNEILKNYKVVVIEQGNSKPFNRGLLLNVGFKHFANKDDDEIILHDVDVIPTKETIINIYRQVLHDDCILGIYGYHFSIGGVTKIKKSIFEKVNGFPTNYWGWGFEDYILKKRVDLAGIRYVTLCEPNTSHATTKFTLLKSPQNEQKYFYTGNDSKKTLSDKSPNLILTRIFESNNLKQKIETISKSGLNTTHYTVLRHLTLDNNYNVEFITVDI
tara:strand:- start:425 stop:1147 length:723 start_codon:yes stop_codon:yes gene_type:complete